MVIVSTSSAMLTIDAAIVDRMGTAASGPPVMLRDELVVEVAVDHDRADR